MQLCIYPHDVYSIFYVKKIRAWMKTKLILFGICGLYKKSTMIIPQYTLFSLTNSLFIAICTCTHESTRPILHGMEKMPFPGPVRSYFLPKNVNTTIAISITDLHMYSTLYVQLQLAAALS